MRRYGDCCVIMIINIAFSLRINFPARLNTKKKLSFWHKCKLHMRWCCDRCMIIIINIAISLWTIISPNTNTKTITNTLKEICTSCICSGATSDHCVILIINIVFFLWLYLHCKHKYYRITLLLVKIHRRLTATKWGEDA